MRTPTVDDVSRIAAIRDPVVRNLQITHCYFELSQAAAKLIGSGANWCTFATWASKQAGQTIRGEDLARALEDRMAGSPEVRLLFESIGRELRQLGRNKGARAIRETVFSALDADAAFARASTAVARGNLKVFAEIGFEFARFLSAVDNSPRPQTEAPASEIPESGQARSGSAASGPPASSSAASGASGSTDRQSDSLISEGLDPHAGALRMLDSEFLASFCASLRAGEPPEGQRLLRDAFTAYGETCRSPDAAARAQLLYFGNILIGLHEQTRLQPEILEAMNATLGDTKEIRNRILKALLPGFWVRARVRIVRILKRELPLDTMLNLLIDNVQQQIRRITTRSLMTLRLAQERTLQLGRDLDEAFPPELARLSHPGLTAMIERIDPTRDSMLESATVDWSDLQDRMHFITDLFRCYHNWSLLFDAPFNESQVTHLNAGRRPGGRL